MDDIFGRNFWMSFSGQMEEIGRWISTTKNWTENWIGLSSPNFLDDKIELASVVQSKGRMFHTQ